MYNLEIIITKDARNYAEALTQAPFNVTDALDKVGYYKHAEAARVDATEEETGPFMTVTTSATLLVRANAYSPEGQIRHEVAKLIAAMGGDKEAQEKAIEHALILLDVVLNDSAVGKTSVRVDENGEWIKPLIPAYTSLAEAEDEEDYEEYYELTLRDINRQQVAIDEAFRETVTEMEALGYVYELEEALTVAQITYIFGMVEKLVERLEAVPYTIRTPFKDYRVEDVFREYKELLAYKAYLTEK